MNYRILIIAVLLACALLGCSSNRSKGPSLEQIAAQQKQAADNRKRWQAQQLEYRRQAKLKQEKAKQQQQDAAAQQQKTIDAWYDNELGVFLRQMGQNQYTALVMANRLRINFFRENNNPSEAQKAKFFSSRQEWEQKNILKLEKPQLVQLMTRFESDLQSKLAIQQNQRSLQALQILSQLGQVHMPAYQPIQIPTIGVRPTPTATGVLSCGLRPLPSIGCQIGRCVNGQWEQVCNSTPALACGLRPLPSIGCRIGRCVNGQWEQVCNSTPTLSCGLQPLPSLGCRIGRCVNGQWEQVCN